MARVPALKAAVDLLHFPSQAARLRAGPLPEGMPLLLRIASGDAEALKEASEGEGRSPETVREAAAFFLEQVLLRGESDSYRSVFANKVTRAWDAIKTPERRAAYDRAQRMNVGGRSLSPAPSKRGVSGRPSFRATPRYPNLLWRILTSVSAFLGLVSARIDQWKRQRQV
jgi:hypothetical protein